jgi:hypothetical protein
LYDLYWSHLEAAELSGYREPESSFMSEMLSHKLIEKRVVRSCCERLTKLIVLGLLGIESPLRDDPPQSHYLVMLVERTSTEVTKGSLSNVESGFSI